MITRPTPITSYSCTLYTGGISTAWILVVSLALCADASAQLRDQLRDQLGGDDRRGPPPSSPLLVVDHDLSALYRERSIKASPLQRLFKQLAQATERADLPKRAGDTETSLRGPPLLRDDQRFSLWSGRAQTPSNQAQPQSTSSLSSRVCRALPNVQCITHLEQQPRYPEEHRARLNELALTFVKRALEAYREVDSSRAHASLDSALELLALSGHALYDPKEVATLHLWRGVISVERKQLLQATLDFQHALLIDPNVRLKPGFDHADTIEVFSQVLSRLRALSRDELARLLTTPEWIARFDQRGTSTQEETLILIRVQGEVFSSLYASKSVSSKRSLSTRRRARYIPLSDQLAYSWETPHLAQMIATEVGLITRQYISRRAQPINNQELMMERGALQILGGWSAHRYLKSSVTGVTHAGPSMKFGWRASEWLELQLGGVWSLDAVDDQRDLTQGVSAWSVYMGPHWKRSWRHTRVSFGVALEGARISDSAITREVGCKFFDLSYTVPREICDPRKDIKILESTWRLSARLEIDARLALSEHIQAGVNVFSSIPLYESSPYPLGLPIGVGVLIGYSSDASLHSLFP